MDVDYPLSMLLKEKPNRIITVEPTTVINEAVNIMNTNKIGCVLVVLKGKLQGVFTERDVLLKVAGKPLDTKTTPVSEVMTANPLTVTPHTKMSEAMRLVTEKRFRHLPMVENGKLLGMISIGDLTRWAMQNQEKMINDLERYIHGDYKA